jgi:Mg2+/Co2+ transporter CorB
MPAEGEVTEAMANPVSPTVSRRTTLKDALSMMLDADVQTGIVVDRTGAALGLLTIEAVAERMREGEHAPAFDQAALAEAAAEHEDLPPGPPSADADANPDAEPQAAEA